jgi:mutator protein MutT
MTDNLAFKFPVSVKGVVVVEGNYPLLLNERNEWELPGGKLEPGENISECVVRETQEELGIDTTIVCELNNWLYSVNSTEVVIITYLLNTNAQKTNLTVSHEHKELKVFSIEEARSLNMPPQYLESLEQAHLLEIMKQK